jgi:hypothetical protein
MSEFKLPKPPFFKPGSLVFYGSRHNLIKDGKYYRCGRASNQICEFHDRRFRIDMIERKFSRFGKKMYQKEVNANSLAKKIMKENFVDLLFGLDDRVDGKEELADATIQVMKESVEKKKKIKKSDEKDFYDNYVNLLKAEHPIMLFGLTLGVMRLLANDLPEAEMGRSLALLAKQIFITDRGEIHSIELERWAWYSINLYAKDAYFNKEKFVKDLKIVNKADSLHELRIVEASLSFDTSDFPIAMNENFLLPVVMMKFMKDSINNVFVDDADEVNKNTLELFNQFQNNPVLRILFGAVPLIPSKK